MGNHVYTCGMTEHEPQEIGLREARAILGDIAHAAATDQQVTYLTSHGRRIAAVVPAHSGHVVTAVGELRRLADKFEGDEKQSYGGANDAYNHVVFELRERADTLEGDL